MNPIRSGISSSHQTVSINASQQAEPSASQAKHIHPRTLSCAQLSGHTQLFLNQSQAQPDGHHQLLVLLVSNGIADSALQIRADQESEVLYEQKVEVPGGEVANLKLRAKLNEQSQYDILAIDFHAPSSGTTTITLSDPAPDPAVTGNYEPSVMAEHTHPGALSPARLSRNAQLALDRTEAQPNGHYQLLALLARNGMTDGTLQIRADQESEVD